MLKHRYIDIICISVMAVACLAAVVLMNGEGIVPASSAPVYADKLFDDSYVHSINIEMDDWHSFIAEAKEEKYALCNVTVDGETFHGVGIRAKGNNSKSLTSEYGLSRYSLKLEFDHFNDTTYHGLDKFSLDSSFQDNSYMKTSLVFDMMDFMGVPTPLTSYVDVKVNGSDWGLFLAVEEPEESFARRNFGNDYGKLYKPDYKRLNDENADVDLRYTGDEHEKYVNIFDNAKFDITDEDKDRLIASLKTLDEGKDIASVVDVEEVISYFAAQVFSMNLDSYIGTTGHNYYLYEKDGVLSMLPWDYNLAFGTYQLGMTNPIRDADTIINYPVNTPWKGEDMLDRPLFHKLMSVDSCFELYHEKLDALISGYFESGKYELFIRETMAMIKPFVEKDATAFCSYKDHVTACNTLIEICSLRAESIRGQLEGKYPVTLAQQKKNPEKVDCSSVNIRDLGDFDDLRGAKERNDKALGMVP